MSVKAISRVWEHSRQGGSNLLVSLALADWADDYGYCYPSLEQIARKCRQTARNVINVIHKLERAGEVRRLMRGGGRGERAQASVYQVVIGLSPEQVAESESISPLAKRTIAQLEKWELGEKFSHENFSCEKSDPWISHQPSLTVNDSPPSPAGAPFSEDQTELAESVYRLVRPTHLTLPRSDQLPAALKVLTLYLQRYGSPTSAAEALKPFADEADARGISPTNLCWLSEWAAVGQIPKRRKRTRANAKRREADATNYDALRKRVEDELSQGAGQEERV